MLLHSFRLLSHLMLSLLAPAHNHCLIHLRRRRPSRREFDLSQLQVKVFQFLVNHHHSACRRRVRKRIGKLGRCLKRVADRNLPWWWGSCHSSQIDTRSPVDRSDHRRGYLSHEIGTDWALWCIPLSKLGHLPFWRASGRGHGRGLW